MLRKRGSHSLANWVSSTSFDDCSGPALRRDTLTNDCWHGDVFGLTVERAVHLLPLHNYLSP
jgi:hypothetical protein